VFVCPLAALLAVAPRAVATPPDISVTITGVLGLNGWYLSNVTVDWQVEGETSSSGCDTVTLIADTPGTQLKCTAENSGDETSKTVTIKLDRTPPSALATADRLPDANGWYNRPLTISTSGSDATSGLESCTSAVYAGPDTAAALVAGSCQDLAGNLAPASLVFKYDATAPTLKGVTTKPGVRSVDILWRASGDARVVEIVRTPGRNGAAATVVYRGLGVSYRDRRLRVGRTYRYRVSALDDAANAAEKTVKVVATGALLRPVPGQRIVADAAPRLMWAPVRRASYYNLQLIRGRKILSVWPARPSFQLRRSWVYNGRRYRLVPGVYHWYVWPGFGRISAARYGRLLGSSTFVIPR
jgi:hypothetical protein